MRTEERAVRSGGGERGTIVQRNKHTLRCDLIRQCLSRGARIALSLMLAVFLAVPTAVLSAMLPRGGAQSTPKAYAAVGATDYSVLFRCEQKSGTPGIIAGNVLTFGSTSTSATSNLPYVYYAGDREQWESSAFFSTDRLIPLTFDWKISFASTQSALNYVVGTHSCVTIASQAGLTTEKSAALLKGPFFALVFSRSGDVVATNLRTVIMNNGFSVGNALEDRAISRPAGPPFSYESTFEYSYANDTLTYTANGEVMKITGVKSKLNGAESAYLNFGGRIQWTNSSQPAVDKHPVNIYGTTTFRSITLPHFSPAIKDIVVYDAVTGKEIESTDSVKPNTRVRVVCQVWNSNASAGREQFPVHVKQAANLMYNFTPDPSVKVKVNNTPVSESLTVGNGVSLTLVGRNVVNVEYVGTIGSDLKKATTVGYTMTDDIFNSSDSQQRTLLEASNLVQGPDSGGSSLKPGSDYHYTRLPAPNANGWNNTPVTVSFYTGDYSTFTITPLSATPIVLSGTSDWTQSDDVDNLSLSYMASNSAGVPSTVASDTMRIDTTPPRLSYDRMRGSVTVDDTPTTRSGGVTSGVWHLYATDAAGTPTSRVQTFALTSGKGAATGNVSGVAAGYYVAEDAAGNRSEVLEVKDAVPPQADRPEGSDLPDPPVPTVSTDFDGTKHAMYEETITQVANASNPAFGGSLDAAAAKAIADGRWHFTDAEGNAMAATTELLDAAGTVPITSLSTAQPGSCTIRQVATDDDGNTATVNIHYVFVAPTIPMLTPQGPSDPDDPDSPKVPTGDPVPPSGPIDIADDGTQTGKVGPITVTDKTHPGTVPADEADKILTDHFALGTAGGEDPTVTVKRVVDADGNPVDVIDQSTPGRYTITYEVTDKDGNTTQVEVDYVLRDTVVNPPDPIVPTPDDPGPTDSAPGNPDDGNGTDPGPSGVVPTPPTVTVKPGDGGGSGSVLTPQPDDNAPNDGRQHVIVSDELTVPTRDMQMIPDDFAALFQERYSIASAQPDGKISAGEVRIYDAQGKRLDGIDRSVEGGYVIEQVFTDSAGNTTTVRLSYRVKAESAVGSLTGDGGDGWSSADGSLGRTWRTATSLPQTGPFSVLCPLHLLFLALAAIAALYGAVRLRMESAARRNLRARDAWVREQLRAGDDVAGLKAAARRGAPRTDDEQAAAATGAAATRRRFAMDGGVLGLVACMAVWLAWSPWCAYDGLLAACVAGLCVLCMAMIHVSAWSTARCRRRCWIVPWAADRGLV